MLEAERSKKDEKGRFKAMSAKYVPSSLNEIQAGFDLDIAKQSKVSFDPDIDYDDEFEETEINAKSVGKQPTVNNSENNGDSGIGADNEVGEKNNWHTLILKSCYVLYLLVIVYLFVKLRRDLIRFVFLKNVNKNS